MQPYQDELGRIATKLDAIERDVNCSWCYRPFLDAVVWADEESSIDVSDSPALGYLFVYRMGLLTGAPNPNLEPLWQYAKLQFPNWPGFQPTRCSYSTELAELIDRARKEQLDRIDIGDSIESLLSDRQIE